MSGVPPRLHQLPRTVKVFLSLVIVFILLFSFAAWSTYSSSLTVGYPAPDYDTRPTSHLNQSKILLVSAFFPLLKSNHPISDYETWLSNFLSVVKTDIYFYTPPDVVPLIERLRGNHPIYINATYSSPFDVPPLEGLEEIYIEMNEVYKDRGVHSHKMSGIWNAKAFFLDEAVRHVVETPLARGGNHHYEYVFWTDAGGMREPNHYEYWPEYNRVDALWEEGRNLSGYMMQKDELLFLPIVGMGVEYHKQIGMRWKDTDGPGYPGVIPWNAGSFLGGPPGVITWFRNIFYSYHNAWLAQGMWVGIDQDIFSAIMLLYPHRFITVWLGDPLAPAHLYTSVPEGEYGGVQELGACGHWPWYYYEFFLSDAETRDKMRDWWLDRISEPENKMVKGNWEGWWKGSNACRLTDLLWCKQLLEREFGKDWIPPQATLVNLENPKPQEVKWL
ncbi:hypothetical protein D9758_004255 [Tetrapyrgos nigripes]|uniref:Uncharacterized protein n=1 Tax=Tetrapyrgos nigripes TaxID=182062 RepID=A0A8H5GTX8_9AGAR|nr:hypothetical protein D9758_004255 [Tetrapyrgos nigripes]